MIDSAEAQQNSGPAGETSVSGLSDQFCETVKVFAASRNEKLRVVYEEAILSLIDRVNGGEDVFFPSVVTGRKWKARHIRIAADVKSAMTETCKRLRVHKSVFFHRALRDYLSSNGISAPE